MATVIGVRFRKAGKVYYFDPCDFWPKPGDGVVVQTARGVEYGEAVTSPRSVSDAQLVSPLPKVVRMATPDDAQREQQNALREQEAFRICQEKIARHKLDMKLVSVEYTFDNSKIIFYFTANGRVDFRELVKDLAGVFHNRIELRQIGVRDEAKMLGGLGSCGRPICCGAFLSDFQPVSIKMAKEQNLSLNPTKISGLCGRLMCCLKYEQDNYEQVLKRLPRVGKDIVTPDGVGVLTEINAIRERVKVRICMGDDEFELREYALDDVRKPGSSDAPAPRQQTRQDGQTPVRHAPIPDQAKVDDPEAAQLDAPRRRVQKTTSTEAFLEQLHGGSGDDHGENAAQKDYEASDSARRNQNRRRHGGRSHHRDENN